MVTISNSTIRQNIFETIYDIVSAITFTSTITTPRITAAFIDDSKSTFPQIVINPVDIGRDTFTIGSDRSASNKNITVVIDVFTKKSKDLDIVSDAIQTAMDTNFSGITLIGTSESNGIVFPNDQKIHQKSITFNFIRR